MWFCLVNHVCVFGRCIKLHKCVIISLPSGCLTVCFRSVAIFSNSSGTSCSHVSLLGIYVPFLQRSCCCCSRSDGYTRMEKNISTSPVGRQETTLVQFPVSCHPWDKLLSWNYTLQSVQFGCWCSWGSERCITLTLNVALLSLENVAEVTLRGDAATE